jgi:lysophospholipase L1-like esterase
VKWVWSPHKGRVVVRFLIPCLRLLASGLIGLIALGGGKVNPDMLVKANSYHSFSRYAILFFSIAFSIIIAEAGAHLYIRFVVKPKEKKYYTIKKPEKWIYTPHHYLVYTNKKNFKNGKQYHNSLGFRGGEFPQKKEIDEYRMVFLGGSTTYSSSIKDNQEIFTSYIQQHLDQSFPTKNNLVINAGVGGYSSHESLINLQFRVLDISPDVIFIYHGPNDVHTRYLPPDQYFRDNCGRRSMWRSDYVRWYHQSAFIRFALVRLGLWQAPDLYRLVSSDEYVHADHRFPDIINPVTNKPFGEYVAKNKPSYFRDNIESMIAIAKSRSISVVLITFAWSQGFGSYMDSHYYQEAIAEQNEILRELALKKKVFLLDLESSFPKDKQLFVDGVHLNKLGSIKKADIIYHFILENGLHYK